MEAGNFLSRFGAGVGRGVLALGTGGISEMGFQRREQEAVQAAQEREQMSQILQSNQPNNVKVAMLSRLSTPEAQDYVKQLMKPVDMPASVQEFQAMQAMPAEQQKAFQQFKNPVAQITPYQQQQLDYQQQQLGLERQKLQGSTDYQSAMVTNQARELQLKAQQLQAAGRTQEAAAVNAQAEQMLAADKPPTMYNYGTNLDPLAGIRDPKRRDIELGKLGSEAEKDIEKQQTIVDQEAATKSLMLKFKDAMGRQGGSGGLVERLAPSWIGGFDPEIADMNAVTAEVAPKMRPAGSGATSDYDAKMFERASVEASKPTQSNNMIIDARIKAADMAMEKADFLEAYRADNGHTRGAEQVWRRYLNANPIFDPKQPNKFVLNKNQRNWREYFDSQQGQKGQQAPRQQQASPLQGLTALPQGFKNLGNGMVQGPDGKQYKVQAD